jgi:hypothetical protein
MWEPSSTVRLCHGFNVWDKGKGTTDKLRPHFEKRGFSVSEQDGGFRFLLGVRFGTDRRAEELASVVRPGDILVGHSDGCNVIDEACWLLSSLNPDFRVRVVYINPALNSDKALAPIVDRALIFHTPSDKVVKWAALLPWHDWGSMGNDGYVQGKRQELADGRYTNVSYESLGLSKLGHSGVFKTQKSQQLAMLAFDSWMKGA